MPDTDEHKSIQINVEHSGLPAKRQANESFKTYKARMVNDNLYTKLYLKGLTGKHVWLTPFGIYEYRKQVYVFNNINTARQKVQKPNKVIFKKTTTGFISEDNK